MRARLGHKLLTMMCLCYFASVNTQEPSRGSSGANREQTSTPPGWTATDEDVRNWLLSTPSSARTLDELAKEGPPDVRGRKGDEDGGGRGSASLPPPGRREGATAAERRPNYFLTVTLPTTAGMAVVLAVFLYLMSTDGPIYRILTQSYTPPAARQQLAEEQRLERLQETERTAQAAWESERARWRSQRSRHSLHPSASSAATIPSTSGAAAGGPPSPSVSWAEPEGGTQQRPGGVGR